MILTPLLATLLAAATALAQSNDPTQLVGTWSSGSQAVQTGGGFANPANESFIYPKTAGVSYSFTQDGYYEIARYRFNGNGSMPTCITGVMNWVHGKYVLNTNGSITMTPFGDGYQQIQDPCAAVSNFVENYNDTELYQSWQIFTDPSTGLKLHLFQFDGSPVAPQFQVSASPNMLPTQMLRNVTPAVTTNNGLTQAAFAISAAERRWSVVGASGLATAVFAIGFASLLL